MVKTFGAINSITSPAIENAEVFALERQLEEELQRLGLLRFIAPANRAELIGTLIREGLFAIEAVHLERRTVLGRRGPKYKLVETTLMAGVNRAFVKAGLTLHDWDNGRGGKRNLAAFTEFLLKFMKIKRPIISARQRRVAKAIRFYK